MSLYLNFIELLHTQYRTVQGLYQRTIRAVCSFIIELIYTLNESANKSLSGRLRELKNKEKSSWVIPKVVAVVFGLFITKFKSQFIRGFTKVVVIRAGRLREWPQGELQLYVFPFHVLNKNESILSIICPGLSENRKN